MKLTNKELIRLKKETFLFEHGFYDNEIRDWYYKFKGKDLETRVEISLKYNLNPYSHKEMKQLWFRMIFSEFFKEENNEKNR